MSKLSVNTQKLLDQLVADLKSKMAPSERGFDVNDKISLIHNLFRGEYEFSYAMYKELFEYLTNIKDHE